LVLIAKSCLKYQPNIHDKGELMMLNQNIRFMSYPFLLLMLALLSGCGYNTFQSSDEDVKAAWAEVLNQYQRRADLVPNLVNVVKGYAAHEKDVLTQVTAARASVGSIKATPELLNDEAAFKKFIAAQGQMTSALERLMVVSENYPQLKADGMFRDLQAQLEGTENRITVARNRYISTVKDYNIAVRSFPTNLTAMIFGYKTKPSFAVENEKAISIPPTVDFGAPAPAQQAAPMTLPPPVVQPQPAPAR
jgi:LemA protein